MEKYSIEWWKKEIKRLLRRNDGIGNSAVRMAVNSIEMKYGTVVRNEVVKELGLQSLVGLKTE